MHVERNPLISKGHQDTNIADIRNPDLIGRSAYQIAVQHGKDRM